MTTRRRFLHSATLLTAASVLPLRSALAGSWSVLHPAIDPDSGPDDPILRQLAMRVLDAARTSGAAYADVRMTADRTQKVSLSDRNSAGDVSEQGAVFIGVRALVDGYWGFAAGCDGSGDAVERLAREAVAQAKVNNWGAGDVVTLDAHPPTATGTWSTPMERDPFTVTVEEKTDFLQGVLGAPELLSLTNISVSCDLTFRRQHKVFAATTGAFLTQTLVWTGPSSIAVSLKDRGGWSRKQLSVPLVPLQSSGYEAVSVLRMHDRLPRYVDELLRQDNAIALPIGRYNVVFDAQTTAALVRSTIGYATELDRINGDEVNAAGTSYLSVKSLGSSIVSPMLTITGSRSLLSGPSRVGWDDDGIAPQPFDLIRDGVLTNLATGREHAGLLAAGGTTPGGNTASAPVISRGCASADHAANLPLVRSPDLVLQPSAGNSTFESLMADTKQGVAIMYGDCLMDRTLATGQGRGTLFEIRDGKLGRYLGQSAAFRFRTLEFWRNITALGGTSSAELHGFVSSKGEPRQNAGHGVVAVPMRAHDVTLFDAKSF